MTKCVGSCVIIYSCAFTLNRKCCLTHETHAILIYIFICRVILICLSLELSLSLCLQRLAAHSIISDTRLFYMRHSPTYCLCHHVSSSISMFDTNLYMYIPHSPSVLHRSKAIFAYITRARTPSSIFIHMHYSRWGRGAFSQKYESNVSKLQTHDWPKPNCRRQNWQVSTWPTQPWLTKDRTF